ncbi:MAG: HYR domain-containing protein, partial [bacterium]
NIMVNNEPGLCGAHVSWTPPTYTGGWEPVTVTSTHNPGDFFPAECASGASATGVAPSSTGKAGNAAGSSVGAECLPGPKGTIVTYTFTDSCGHTKVCSFKVVVLDKEAPVVSGCPADITVAAAAGAVSWTPPTFTDNCSPVTVTSTHNPGDIFPVGSTLVTYTASDACGNVSTACSFMVTVTAGEPLTLENCPPDITVSNDPGQCGAAVSWTPPTFSGSCNGPVNVTSTHNPGDFFPAGCEAAAQGTVVTYIATDASGNTATCSFKVTVLDSENPVITVFSLKDKYFSTDIVDSNKDGIPDGFGYAVVDTCDFNPSVSVELSNNGHAPVDMTMASPIPLNLAELVGNNVITLTATDACGNISQTSVKFSVILRLAEEQIELQENIQNTGTTILTAFIQFPAPYDLIVIQTPPQKGIYGVRADGAPALSINRDWVERKVICKFNEKDVTEYPADTHFKVNGFFEINGEECEFLGAGYVYREHPEIRTPVAPPPTNTNPKTPSVPKVPTIVLTPSISQTPSTPQTPSISQTPSAAEPPAVTQTPSIPKTPAVTQTPSTLQMPSIPATPSIPQTPSTPKTPDVIQTPGTLQMPRSPQTTPLPSTPSQLPKGVYRL